MQSLQITLTLTRATLLPKVVADARVISLHVPFHSCFYVPFQQTKNKGNGHGER